MQDFDPFAIQIPTNISPVHRAGSFFHKKRGHEIQDFFVKPEKQTPYLGVSIHVNLLKILNFLILLTCFLFLIRLSYLQILKGAYYRNVAEGNRIRLESIHPQRGLILDRNDNILAQNTLQMVLGIRPIDLPQNEIERERIVDELKKIVDPLMVDEALQPGFVASWIPLKENLSHTEAVNFISKFSNTPGVEVRQMNRRQYNIDDAQSLSHLLGYTGKLSPSELDKKNNEYPVNARIGKTGLELVYESVLRGSFGRKQIEVDSMGREKQIIAKEDAVGGRNLMLTLDLELQKKAEAVLNEYLNKFNKQSGAIVILNPQNGEILSLVSLPAYDNNNFEFGISSNDYSKLIEDSGRPFFSRAVSGTYPSGSTIKPIVAAGALEEGVITPFTTINSVGGIYIGQWSFPDWKTGGHGLTNVYKAIAESVNTFFYYVGGGYGNFNGLSIEKLDSWIKEFGFGKKTGIDLPNEASGFVPTEEWKNEKRGEPWYIGDTYHLSIGQGYLLVTPLQITAAISTIANGGIYYGPHLVKSFTDLANEVTTVQPKILKQNFISESSLEVVRDGMRQGVTYGSSRFLANLPVSVAGKTGTAEWNSNRLPHAWFTGFAPIDNPQIAITVLVEEGGEGSSISVPIAKEILSWYFSNRLVP